MLCLSLVLTATAEETKSPTASPYAQWSRGPSADPAFFPLAVWCQDPANAVRYRQAGFNTFVALWEGPTEEQLAKLKQAGLRTVCAQNEVGLRHLDDPTIIAWMHNDEPDNAQSRGARLGWSDPILPEKVVRDYRRMKAADPSRPVLLNLGQGVAWDGWYGRGSRKNHPEDYPQYLAGCDIASFDIYPVVHDSEAVRGKLWFVAKGVERLVRWGEGRKIVWNALECTRISSPRKPTPQQVRCEAWMSLIHGSHGLIFFVHQFKPQFREAALLDDAEMTAAIRALNAQITSLAPVLNSVSLTKEASVKSTNPEVPIALMAKRVEGTNYVFAVAMRDGVTEATFSLKAVAGEKTVEVIGEDRALPSRDGVFKDHFTPWDVHLYRVSGGPTAEPLRRRTSNR